MTNNKWATALRHNSVGINHILPMIDTGIERFHTCTIKALAWLIMMKKKT